MSLADLCYKADGKLFEGFQIHDFPPRYYAAYLYYGFKKGNPTEIQSMFDKLLVKHKVGPSLGMNVPNEDKLPKKEKKVDENAIDQLKNYDSDKVRKATRKVRETIDKNNTLSVGKNDTTRK